MHKSMKHRRKEKNELILLGFTTNLISDLNVTVEFGDKFIQNWNCESISLTHI